MLVSALLHEEGSAHAELSKPTKQNVLLQAETLEKIDILRDAARKQGVMKSYPGVVADAVNMFYAVSAGGSVVATADAVQG